MAPAVAIALGMTTHMMKMVIRHLIGTVAVVELMPMAPAAVIVMGMTTRTMGMASRRLNGLATDIMPMAVVAVIVVGMTTDMMNKVINLPNVLVPHGPAQSVQVGVHGRMSVNSLYYLPA